MRQKMPILKEENSVWWGPKFLRVFKNLMGAMLMKIVILLKENESHMAKNSVF